MPALCGHPVATTPENGYRIGTSVPPIPEPRTARG